MAQWLIGLSCGLSGQRWPSSKLNPYKYQRMAGVVRGAIKDSTGRFRDDYRLGRTRYVDFNNYGSIDSTGHIPWTAWLHGWCHGFRVLPYYQGFRAANRKLIRTHRTSHAQMTALGKIGRCVRVRFFQTWQPTRQWRQRLFCAITAPFSAYDEHGWHFLWRTQVMLAGFGEKFVERLLLQLPIRTVSLLRTLPFSFPLTSVCILAFFLSFLFSLRFFIPSLFGS